MVTSVSCQSCGARITAEYARVFGNDDDELYACPECSTQRAVARGAGVDADRDGTLLVHRPGTEQPVPAVLTEDTDESDRPGDRLTLTETAAQFEQTTVTDSSSDDHTDDEAFAALVAE